MRALFTAAVMALVVAMPLFAAENTVADYKMTLLLNDASAPGMDPATGALAAEVLSSELQKTGLFLTVRPVVAVSKEYGLVSPAISANDIVPTTEGWAISSVDAYGQITEQPVPKIISLPSSDAIVKTSVSWIGNTWWLSAQVVDRLSGEQIAAASADASGDRGLIIATKKVAAKIHWALAASVIDRRVETTCQGVAQGIIEAKTALAKFVEWNKQFPRILSPLAGIAWLIQHDPALDNPDLQQLLQQIPQNLEQSGIEGKRLMLRLGLASDQPLEK